jgi:putative phosphoesterase
MRIAVIADTHMPLGRRRLPDDCVRRLRAADLILHAGDISRAAFLAELASLGPPLQAVHGNVDEPALARSLPEARVVEAGGARIGLVHVAGPREGREARLLARFPECGAIVYGHTHLPQVERHQGVWVLNPGSPTERRRAPARTMLELTVRAGSIEPRLIGFEQSA